jgi:hypothetical protein
VHCAGRRVSRSRQARVGDADEQRKQPRPENEGDDRFAMTPKVHAEASNAYLSIERHARPLLTRIKRLPYSSAQSCKKANTISSGSRTVSP